MATEEPAAGPRPYTLVAELTYRCPLRCVYCSNPIEYAGGRGELATEAWLRVLTEAEALGVVQLHFSGGEPLLRPDLQELCAHARSLGLYTSLITSAIGATPARLRALRDAGLESVQISIQGLHEADAERYAGRPALAEKLAAARAVRELGLPLTLNVVLHRGNIDQVEGLIELALELGATRLELANTQYLGWALANREALLPSAAQIELARTRARAARERLRGRLELLFVLPDYYADKPRACMDGWGRRYLVVNPDGLVLPCHLAHTLPGLEFERAGARPLAEIWRDGSGIQAFRGEAWMKEPCRSCEQRTRDFGGCRCQAFHLLGDASLTDPACVLSPEHARVLDARETSPLVALRYRRMPGVAS